MLEMVLGQNIWHFSSRFITACSLSTPIKTAWESSLLESRRKELIWKYRRKIQRRYKFMSKPLLASSTVSYFSKKETANYYQLWSVDQQTVDRRTAKLIRRTLYLLHKHHLLSNFLFIKNKISLSWLPKIKTMEDLYYGNVKMQL